MILAYATAATKRDVDPLSELPPASKTNSRIMMYHIDIFIAAVIAFFILLRLPRGLARIWRTSEWTSGHLLKYEPGVARSSSDSSNPTLPPKGGAENHSLLPTLDALYINGAHEQDDSKPSQPPHVPAYPAFLRPSVAVLRTSVIPGYANYQVLILLGYFGTLLYAFTYQNNFFGSVLRPAWLAASQLPFVYVFAAKNNVLGWLLGLGYQNLNYIHRFIGTMVFLAVNVHAVGMLYRWGTEGKLAVVLQIPYLRWGAITLICIDVLFLFSLPIFRRKAFKVFRATHVVGYLLIIPALSQHQPATFPYIIAVSVIYLLDRILCLVKTRLVSARIYAVPSLSSTRIEIKGLNSGWRAGQHVRIRVLSASLGWFNWLEAHPFTIASAPASSAKDGHVVGDEGLVLICKKTGGWTTRLFNLANGSNVIRTGDRPSVGRAVRLVVEGPYGGPGHAIFASYSAVAMIVGGSGITFALSTVQDLVQKSLKGESRVTAIELVWVVKGQEAVADLSPLFTSLVRSCPHLNITVHYTHALARNSSPVKRIGSGDEIGGSSSLNTSERLNDLPMTVQVGRPGRLDLINVMERAISRAITSHQGGKRLLVGVCGPEGLEKDVMTAVDNIDSMKRDEIGGVEMHTEVFGM